MSICIPKNLFKKIEDAGVFKEQNSIKREEMLSSFLNKEDARIINNKFEKTLLLKRTKIGFQNMVKKLTLTDKERLDLIRQKNIEIERKLKALNDLSSEGTIKTSDILNYEKTIDSLYAKKYKKTITSEQIDLVRAATEKVKITSELPKTKDGSFNFKNGIAQAELGDIISAIKNPKLNLSFGKHINATKNEIINKIKDEGNLYQKIVRGIIESSKLITNSTLKTLKASLDFSLVGIQGPMILTTSPKIFKDSIIKAINTFRSPNAMNEFRAFIFADKDYIKSMVGKTRLLTQEEQLAGSNIIEKIPYYIGKTYKRFDDSFSIFLQNARFNEFKKVLRFTEDKIGRELDINVPEDVKILKELGAHANKVTGTTNLGVAEQYSSLLNRGLFAARFVTSDLRIITDLFDPGISMAGRKRAALVLGKNVGLLYGSYLTFAMLNPDTTRLNPNDTNFMKVKTGPKTWVPFLPVKGKWVYQLIARMTEGFKTNAVGRKIVFGEGFKAETRGSDILRTLRGRVSPGVGLLTNILTGKDFMGKKITFTGQALDLVTPISLGDIIERTLNGKSDVSESFYLGVGDIIGLSGYKLN